MKHKIEGKILTSVFRHVNGEDTAGEATFYYGNECKTQYL